MHKPRIIIPDDAPPVMGPSQAYQNLLSRAEVAYFDSLPPSRDVLFDRIGDAELIINIRSSVAFPDEVLAGCPKLKVLSIWGTGTDHIDLPAAARRGVTVTNTPGVSAFAMAEHALALMLAVARNIPQIDAATKQGEWPRGFITQLHGKTLGVIGLGAIGRQTARIARGIGMRVLAWTMHPSEELARELGVELVELDEIYRSSDVVSLHLRLSPETAGFVGAREFGLMKPTAIFINTARGAITDEAALVAALREKRIAGAGLDVFQSEPLPKDHALLRLSNVVVTPHSGGITTEALEAGLQLSIDNVFAFLAGKPQNVVVGPGL
jgi:phosphoglycerate dehydrogenase-like enzyme